MMPSLPGGHSIAKMMHDGIDWMPYISCVIDVSPRAKTKSGMSTFVFHRSTRII